MANGLAAALEQLGDALTHKRKQVIALEESLEETRRTLEKIKDENAQIEADIDNMREQNEQMAVSNILLEDALQVENETLLRLEDHLQILKEKNRFLEDVAQKESDAMEGDMKEMEESLEKQASAYQAMDKTRHFNDLQAENDRLKNLLKVLSMKEDNEAMGCFSRSEENLLEGITSFKEFCIRLAEMRRERLHMTRLNMEMEQEIRLVKSTRSSFARKRTLPPVPRVSFTAGPKEERVPLSENETMDDTMGMAAESIENESAAPFSEADPVAEEAMNEPEASTDHLEAMTDDQNGPDGNMEGATGEGDSAVLDELDISTDQIPDNRSALMPSNTAAFAEPVPSSSVPRSPMRVSPAPSRSSDASSNGDFITGLLGKSSRNNKEKPAQNFGFGGFGGMFNTPASPAVSEGSDEGQGFGTGFFGFGGFGGPSTSGANQLDKGKKTKPKPFSLF